MKTYLLAAVTLASLTAMPAFADDGGGDGVVSGHTIQERPANG